MAKRAEDRARFMAYDTGEFDFARVVAEDVFRVDDLARLHEVVLAQKRKKASAAALTYQDNMTLRRMMAAMPSDSRFFTLYHRFVWEVLAPPFGGRLSYNMRPTFRVHMAGTPSVSKWHTDVQVTGRNDQINVWMPFVDAYDTSTIWVETNYGTEDYQPIDVRYGEVLLFDGGLLLHGSVPNETNVTRVSADFRFAPLRTDLRHRDHGILGARPRGYVPPSKARPYA